MRPVLPLSSFLRLHRFLGKRRLVILVSSSKRGILDARLCELCSSLFTSTCMFRQMAVDASRTSTVTAPFHIAQEAVATSTTGEPDTPLEHSVAAKLAQARAFSAHSEPSSLAIEPGPSPLCHLHDPPFVRLLSTTHLSPQQPQ